MSTQCFVYGEFATPDEAQRAVSALVDGSFDPDDIDVLSVNGANVERVPIQHHRPVLAGALIGVMTGMLVGLSIGLMSAVGGTADAWTSATRWILLGAANGFLAGALGGLVWWRSGVRIKGALAEAQRFVVGTIVTDNRNSEVRGRHLLDAVEAVVAERLVVPTA